MTATDPRAQGAFHERHRHTLEAALEAIASRGYWSAYPESSSPKVYGETAKADGDAAFAALHGKRFETGQEATHWVGAETSPFGPQLDIHYPANPSELLVERALSAQAPWAAATPEERAGVAIELLARINRHSFLIANAVQHTTGQAFPMAFQAGGPHAQDRGLEAVAYAFAEQKRVPTHALWEKPQGRGAAVVLEKQWRILPRGPALVIGCATFPTWNSYPGLFASLVTGNAVLVKPHPGAILPLAITVQLGRAVFAEAGFPPDVLQLAPDTTEAPITRDLALAPDIGIVDFTGSPAFGSWLRANLQGKALYTEEAGINPVAILGTSDFKGMCTNLAFSLSLYSGQMCTAPQNLFIPESGIETDEGHKSFAELAAAIASAIDALLSDPARATAILGAIQAQATLDRIDASRSLGQVVRDSAPLDGAGAARTATPLLLAVDAEAEASWGEERFGPIAFLIRCRDAAQAIELGSSSARTRGAITASLYATDPAHLAEAEAAFARSGAALSVNLTGNVFVNQSAAFSDFHVSGANPAGNACLTDTAFIAGRFRIASLRRPVPA